MQPLPRVRRFNASTPHVPEIRAFHTLAFMDVAAAVDFCHRLVPFVVPHCGDCFDDDARVAVWFHVPERSQQSTTDGCVLFASEGALGAARRGGLQCAVVGEIEREQLPDTSVLVFGEDASPPRRERRIHLGPESDVRTLPAAIRADAVLR